MERLVRAYAWDVVWDGGTGSVSCAIRVSSIISLLCEAGDRREAIFTDRWTGGASWRRWERRVDGRVGACMRLC